MPINTFSIEALDELVKPIKHYLKSSNIVLSINYFRLGIPNYSYNSLISYLLYEVGINQIAIQTYSEFPSRKNRVFNRYTTPVAPYLSTISKQAFKAVPERRLLSATHSFIIYGSNDEINSRIFSSAFGEDSIFAYFLSNDFYWLNLGSRLNETCTFMHHVEWKQRNIIDYRSSIEFKVILYPGLDTGNFVEVEYEYFASNTDYPNLTSDWSSLYKVESIARESFGPTELVSSFNSLCNINDVAGKLIRNSPMIFTRSIS